jgi:NAD(P)H-dependent FMN reductase
MKIQVIVASTRPGRIGDRVGKWVADMAAVHPGFEVELVDLADYPLPHFDEAVSPRYNPSREPNVAARRWLAKIGAADGYVVVTPEYNHSFPGILKDAIDYADFQLQKKPVAIVSYGTVGGARAAEQLKLVLIEAKAAVVPEALALIGVKGIVDEAGRYTGDKDYGPATQLRHNLNELSWWADALKAGRENKSAVTTG